MILEASREIWNFWRALQGLSPEEHPVAITPPTRPSPAEREAADRWLEAMKKRLGNESWSRELIKRQKLLQVTARILWETDPLGARKVHELQERLDIPCAPADEKLDLRVMEYREEAYEITRKLHRTRSFGRFRKDVLHNFKYINSVDYSKDNRLLKACREIWNLWRTIHELPPEQFKGETELSHFPGVFEHAGERHPAADQWLKAEQQRFVQDNQGQLVESKSKLAAVFAWILGEGTPEDLSRFRYGAFHREALTISRNLPRFGRFDSLVRFSAKVCEKSHSRKKYEIDLSLLKACREIWNLWRTLQGLPPKNSLGKLWVSSVPEPSDQERQAADRWLQNTMKCLGHEEWTRETMGPEQLEQAVLLILGRAFPADTQPASGPTDAAEGNEGLSERDLLCVARVIARRPPCFMEFWDLCSYLPYDWKLYNRQLVAVARQIWNLWRALDGLPPERSPEKDDDDMSLIPSPRLK